MSLFCRVLNRVRGTMGTILDDLRTQLVNTLPVRAAQPRPASGPLATYSDP